VEMRRSHDPRSGPKLEPGGPGLAEVRFLKRAQLAKLTDRIIVVLHRASIRSGMNPFAAGFPLCLLARMRRLLTMISCVALLAGCATSSVQSEARTQSTPELKRREAQLRQNMKDWRLRFQGGWGGTSIHQYDMRDVHIIEKELFRRFRAGDKDAWIPLFGTMGYRAPR